MLTRLPLIAVLAMLLSGCSLYHPLRGGVGYIDTPIGADAIQVTYVGSGDMPMAQARDYAVLRAAELTVLRNDAYLQVVGEQAFVSAGMRYSPGENFAYVGGFGGRHYRHAVIYEAYSPGYFEPYAIPEFTLTVRPTAEPGPASIPANYLIQRAIAGKVKVSKGVAERAAGMPLAAPAARP